MDHNEAIKLLGEISNGINAAVIDNEEVLLLWMQPEAVRAIGQAICPSFCLEEQAAVTLMGIPVIVAHDRERDASDVLIATDADEDRLFVTVCQHLCAYFHKYRKWPRHVALSEAAVASLPKSWSDGFAAPIGKVVASRHNVILMGD